MPFGSLGGYGALSNSRPSEEDETCQDARFPRCWQPALVVLNCLPAARALDEVLFALPDTLHARVFFVRLGVDTQQAAIFFLQRVAVGEQTLIRLL